MLTYSNLDPQKDKDTRILGTQSILLGISVALGRGFFFRASG